MNARSVGTKIQGYIANVEKNEIKPWQVKSWVIGKPSATYVAKMEDVLDVYARPYDPKRPVVCVDEGGKELRTTPRGTLPMEPGQPAREDYEYERNVSVKYLPPSGSFQISL